MSNFTKTYSAFRMVATQRGDTLQDIAARELSDASRWVELIYLNSLLPPYLTDDASEVKKGVLLTGSHIRVPGTQPAASGVTSSDDVYGQDLYSPDGKLHATAGGDLEGISGPDNLAQALLTVIATEPKELIWHLSYGCRVHELIGRKGSPVVNGLAATFVRTAVLADPRVSSVQSMTATISGDSIAVDGVVVGTGGRRVPISTEN